MSNDLPARNGPALMAPWVTYPELFRPTTRRPYQVGLRGGSQPPTAAYGRRVA